MRSLKAFKISLGFVINTIVLLILSSGAFAKPPVIQAAPPDILSLRMESLQGSGTDHLVLSGAYLSGGATPNLIVNSFPNATSIGGKYAFAAVPKGKIYVAYTLINSNGYDLVLKEYSDTSTLRNTQQVAILPVSPPNAFTPLIGGLDIKLDSQGNPYIAVAIVTGWTPALTHSVYLYHLQNGVLVNPPMTVQQLVTPNFFGSYASLLKGEVKMDSSNMANNRLYLTAAIRDPLSGNRLMYEFEVDTTNFSVIATNQVSQRFHTGDRGAISASFPTLNGFVAISGVVQSSTPYGLNVYHNQRTLPQNQWAELSQLGIFESFDCKLDAVNFLECGAVDFVPSGPSYAKELTLYITTNPTCANCWVRHAIPGTLGIDHSGVSIASGFPGGIPTFFVATTDQANNKVFYTSNLSTWNSITIPKLNSNNRVGGAFLEKYF